MRLLQLEAPGEVPPTGLIRRADVAMELNVVLLTWCIVHWSTAVAQTEQPRGKRLTEIIEAEVVTTQTTGATVVADVDAEDTTASTGRRPQMLLAASLRRGSTETSRLPQVSISSAVGAVAELVEVGDGVTAVVVAIPAQVEAAPQLRVMRPKAEAGWMVTGGVLTSMYDHVVVVCGYLESSRSIFQDFGVKM